MTPSAFRNRGLCWLGLGLVLLVLGGAGAAGGSSGAYSRAAWRFGWDEDGDCQSTRQEVLLRDAQPGTAVLSPDGCHVIQGTWEDAYTGALIHQPALLDVDHVVALKDASDSGGASWPPEKKRAFANDLRFRHHLKVTLQGVNREKGAQGPDTWRPPDPARWCAYGLWRAAIKASWGLRVRPQEAAALREMLMTCP